MPPSLTRQGAGSERRSEEGASLRLPKRARLLLLQSALRQIHVHAAEHRLDLRQVRQLVRPGVPRMHALQRGSGGDMTTTLALPFPPTVNTYWRTPREGLLAGRTLLSAKARSFRSDCAKAIMCQGPRNAITGRLSVTLDLYPPDKRRRDIDNLTKGTLDALQHCGVIEDDGNIDRLLIQRMDVVKGGKVIVTIQEAS